MPAIGWDVLALLAGIALLYGGGEGLVAGASRIALRARISPLIVGLTVVSFATSSPELVVSLRAVSGGFDDIAIGNAVGSNICNVLLILGVTAVVRPIAIHVKLLRLDLPIMVTVSALLWLLLWWDDFLSRTEALGLLSLLFAYIGFNIWESRRERLVDTGLEAEEVTDSGWRAWTGDAVLVVGGLAALVIGAGFFVRGAANLAAAYGVSQAVIGLTVVALGTSLPELAASVLAAARGKSDLAIGNVVGSNVFNILCILGVAGTVHPLARGGVSHVDLAVMMGSSAILLVVLSDSELNRWEGAVGIVAYVAYVALCMAPGHL